MKKNRYVVAVGNAFVGIALYGPFKTDEKAKEFAESLFGDEYHIIMVQRP